MIGGGEKKVRKKRRDPGVMWLGMHVPNTCNSREGQFLYKEGRIMLRWLTKYSSSMQEVGVFIGYQYPLSSHAPLASSLSTSGWMNRGNTSTLWIHAAIIMITTGCYHLIPFANLNAFSATQYLPTVHQFPHPIRIYPDSLGKV